MGFTRRLSIVFISCLLGSLAGASLSDSSLTVAAQTSASTPSVDEILDKYVQAIGGRAALEKVTTRMLKGTIDLPATGDAGSIVPGTIEVYAKAPNRREVTTVIPGNGTDQRGYNGSAGWFVDPDEGPKDLSGSDLDAMKADAPFNREIRLKELYPKMTVSGKATVNGRQTYVVDAPVASGVEKFYFDVENGLMVRDDAPVEIPDEGVTTQVSLLEDYRDVDGVKMPFTISRTRPDGDSTIRFTEIRNNVQIDDAKFEKPKAPK